MKMMQTITEFMIKDHKRLMDLFNDFKSVKNEGKKKTRKLFAKFHDELKKHVIAEEKIINSVFGKKKNRNNLLPIASSIKSQHDKINNILENISISIKNNNATIDTSDMYLILRRHKNVEERLFYPKLDEMLSEKEKNTVLNYIKNKS